MIPHPLFPSLHSSGIDYFRTFCMCTEISENYFQRNNKTKSFFLEIFPVPPKQTEPRSDS